MRHAPVWRLPEEDDQTGRLRSRIISINKDAARFYFSRLQFGRRARRTGVLARSAAFPTRPSSASAWDMRRTASERRGIICESLGYTEDELLAAGLVKRSEKGGTVRFVPPPAL